MLTTWGKKLLLATAEPLALTFPNIGGIAAEDHTGAACYIGNTSSVSSMTGIKTALSTSSVGVAFGAGNTSPTATDHALESMITGNITIGSPVKTVSFDETNDEYIQNYDYTITNSTGSDIVVQEIGRFVCVFASTTKGGTVTSSNKKCVMLDRTLLDSPVTIPAGEAGTVRYQIKYDMS